MNETQIQDKYLVEYFTNPNTGLGYREIKASTISKDLIAVPDLVEFLSETELNSSGWKSLLRKYGGDKEKVIEVVLDQILGKVKNATNMAIFLNFNKSITVEGVKLHLFYPSGTSVAGDSLFDQNIFSIAQEYPYKFVWEGVRLISFRPDLTFFVNGFYIGYSEFKSTYNNQNAKNQGREKVIGDYLQAVRAYDKIAGSNDTNQSIRKDFLKVFEKAIFITASDLKDTFVIRNIEGPRGDNRDIIRGIIKEEKYDFQEYKAKAINIFKNYPVEGKNLTREEKFKQVYTSLYSKKMLEKEILYYNFIEKDKLISPRPKQKFGTDKIIAKIDEFLDHENDGEYFLNKLKDQLKYIGEEKRQEIISKRHKYQNNKNVYSLLMQYAAGFGKSNIIGWTTLQLKDLKRNGENVYDKVIIVVDRLQLRDQITEKMYSMNVDNKMFIEANNKKSFINALSGDTRIVIVNLQKFGSALDILDPIAINKLSKMRVAFLIDEIHRSNSGEQHQDMVSIFDEIQSGFDKNSECTETKKKKNLIIGFTATPSDHTLSRFGEFSNVVDGGDKIWVPFDSYTMKEAISDRYILNPLVGLVPVSAKMYFEKPEDILEGFEGDNGYGEIDDKTDTGIDLEGKKYAIRKKQIYNNKDRIEAISKWIVERLLTVVYGQIRGAGKAMLAVSSIECAKLYKQNIDKFYKLATEGNKYDRFVKAPIYIVFSEKQGNETSFSLNGGKNEKNVIDDFSKGKNGLIIVVDKLQTGYDEPKLHTLFLDKEITGINAIQTISRVNRTTKYKNDCKIIDFSYQNVNIINIKNAFEHFSNLVISDFDPIGDEKLLENIYCDLVRSDFYQTFFNNFQINCSDTLNKINLQNEIISYFQSNPANSKEIKIKTGQYFKILNLIENVITIDQKYTIEKFLYFWRKFNVEYKENVNKTGEISYVDIYFDNKIGFRDLIIDQNYIEETKSKAKVINPDTDGKKYRFDILAVIAKRNEAEEKIADKIIDFENKIIQLFNFINTHTNGSKLIAKINSSNTTITQNEVLNNFENIFYEFLRKNKESLGEFFIKQSKELTEKLCEDYKIFKNSQLK